MGDSTSYDVFLSYSKRDSAFVEQLAEALRSRNVAAWYDEGAFRWGDNILHSLENALEQSRYFVLVVSPSYLASQWANFEMGVALGRGLPIFMILTQDVDLAALPPRIAQLQALRATEVSVDRIAAAIAAAVKADKGSREPAQR
jgi:predicted nucleotide-binding protein